MHQRSDQPLVQLTGISKSFGSTVAVQTLDLAIYAGDFLAILGPSGCGKTTLLNMIAGFLRPDSGTIEIAGTDVTRLGPERRPTNMVFQSYGLFPHMTVRQNIAYGLRIRRAAKAEIEKQVTEIVDLVHLEGLEERRINQLSGGQAQRVALARALIMHPTVLLLDEPLAALDLQLRKAMQEELRRIHHEIGGTFVFVTHDQGEAMALANRIAVMKSGRIVQEGSAEEVYARPSTRFVSTFIGEANVFPGRRTGGEVVLDIGPRFPHDGPDGPVVSVVRLEAIRLLPRSEERPPGLDIALPGRVEDAVFLGGRVRYKIVVGSVSVIVEDSSAEEDERLPVGSEALVAWRYDDQRVLADE